MDILLTRINQPQDLAQDQQPLLGEVTPSPRVAPEKPPVNRLASFEDALEALKSQPDYETLSNVLHLLLKGVSGNSHGQPTNIHQLVPLNSQLVQTLVTQIVPNYWQTLRQEENDQVNDDILPASRQSSLIQRLLECLRSLTGVNAILVHLKGVLGAQDARRDESERSLTSLNLQTLLDLLSVLLEGDDSLYRVWRNSTSGLDDPIRLRPLSQEFTNVLGGSKIVSLSAEAERLVQQASEGTVFWPANSKEYSLWLARNLVTWVKKNSTENSIKQVSGLLIKTSQLGHYDSVVRRFVEDLILGEIESDADLFMQLLQQLPQYEQKRIILSVLRYASDHLGSAGGDTTADSATISAVAGVLNAVVRQDERRRCLLANWLTSASGAAAGEPVGIRRAAIAVIAKNTDDVVSVLEKSLAVFGDNLYVKHAPLLQQEAHAQVVLLSAGYVYRASPKKISILVRSSAYLNAVSGRLNAPQTKARVLGMIVGEAISSLAQDSSQALKFDMDVMKTEDAKSYKSLVQVSDQIGPLSPLRHGLAVVASESAVKRPTQVLKTAREQTKPQLTKQLTPKRGIVIEEIQDSEEEEEEEDDLVAYAKPDSDPEDSEDDAELVNRDKPRSPVYIRDLIAYLRDSDNYDRQRLGLTTAPVLIRRKAQYGMEVRDHAVELAGLLVGIQDKFKIDDFQSLRTESMVALIVAQPQTMGPWFAKTFFAGDYSISQRASVLTAMGLASREIAGYEKSEFAGAASFSSKRLPEKMEKLYIGETEQRLVSGGSSLKALPPSAMENIAQSITRGFLAPMVATAADAQTGPDVLKLSSFTSRLQQRQGEGSSPSPRKQKTSGVRAISNTSAQLISTYFFFPLTARFQAALSSSTTRARNIVLQPELLTHLLRTLGILVHAAGPSTLSLPDMTAELWQLLLGSGVRARCAGDLGVTRTALFALLALLEVNGNDEMRMRDICRELAREVVETQEWVAQIFDNTRGGDGEGGEENEVKILAAGVLIRLRDAMERFRAFLIGDMIG